MANGQTAEVVRYFRRKNASGYDDPTYLGAEQRFVNALRNSNVNNLEEQFVAGTDTYTEEYLDNYGNQIIVKNFCAVSASPSDTTDYYKLVTTKYKSGGMTNSEYYYDGETFVMPNDTSQVTFGDGSAAHPSLTTVYGENREVFYITADGVVQITPLSFAITQEDSLYFVRSGQPDLPVLTKMTGIKYISDSGIEKKITKESIINHLIN